MSERKLAVNGQFYPDEQNELNRYINHFNKVLDENSVSIDKNLNARGIIVPHAGYIYSGFTANLAFKYIPEDIQNIIVIGPSHKYGFDGASVSLYDKYPTPLGDLKINQELAKELVCEFPFLSFYDEVHCEHSTETQFPFIKNYKENINVVEIVYSQCEYHQLSQVFTKLLEDKNNFLVISSDLSHFYELSIAQQKDMKCLEAIEKKDLTLFTNECEACGLVGIKALIETVNKFEFETLLLDYRTSADTSGDTTSVVGYSSFVIYEK